MNKLTGYYSEIYADLKEKLAQVFVKNALNNRGLLTSPQQADHVASRLTSLFHNYLNKEAAIEDVEKAAVEFADQGMAFETATHLMATISEAAFRDDMNTAVFSQITAFQFIFLEHLVKTHDQIQQQIQENAQKALQETLQEQLENQRKSHNLETQRTHDLNQILRLNTRLASTDNEEELLNEAVIGICRALQLMDVCVYQYFKIGNNWGLRAISTDTIPQISQEQIQQFNAAIDTDDEIVQYHTKENGDTYLSVSTILKAGQKVLGAMIVWADQLERHDENALLILIRTFSQNLASQWNNLFLLQETKRRSRELEVHYGRFVDQLWREETAGLYAKYHQGQLKIDRNPNTYPLTEEGMVFPLQIGEYTIGNVQLPETTHPTNEDYEFIQTILREMGDALNNAYLLQTTRSFSTQLEVAAEVSRAASTILDQTQLIEEVVNLIRERFSFYYVGLFLVDEATNTAVLKAGTGKAGKIQLARKHALEINDNSMIGAAIASESAFVEQDVTHAKAFKRNPILPDTESELALPLRTHDRTIGALTVQSAERGAFSQTAVTVLQSLADQLAIAIENASLFAKTQQNLEEVNRLYEAGRQISTSPDAKSIYQILIRFAAKSKLFDIAQAIIEDPADPDYLILIASWNQLGLDTNVGHRFLRDDYAAGDLLDATSAQWLKDDFDLLSETTKKQFAADHIKGAIFLPLHNENEWLGTLMLACSYSPLPDKQAVQTFRTLVRQASINLANHQLLQQTEALYRIGRSITQTITRDDALNIAVKEVAEYTGATQCRLVLYDQQLGIGQIVASTNTSGMIESINLPMLGDYAFEYLSREKRPLLLEENDTNAPPETIQQHILQFGVKASVLIPSASQQELIGFLAIDSARGKRPFKPSNIIFAQTILDHVTTQIENIKLLDEALSRAQELITLNQIQSNISGVLDISSLATTVYDQVGRLLDNTIFILAQYESKTNSYTPLFTVYNGQAIDMAPRTLSPAEPLFEFLQKSMPIATNSQSPLLQTEARYLPATAAPPQSALWIPLQQEGQPIGVMSVQSFDAKAYTEQDIQLLRSVATQTSLAMANAQLFETIQANNEKLRQLDHLKNQFLANMSHELRTPLNSIIGFSRVILKGIDGPITTEQEEDLSSIYHNGQHLLTLINEILDMAKIEAGKMSLSIGTVDIVETAKAAGKTITGLIQEDKIEFIWDVPNQLPTIEADQVRLRQVFINLLSNAIKYTQTGTVSLSIRQKLDQVQICVKDTGIGIAQEDYGKIFSAFEQVDNSTTRTAGGTGLGLPITKWIVEMHNGRIWFESELNRGSTFYVSLPLSQKMNTQGKEITLS